MTAKFEETLRAVRGIEGIVAAVKVGNTAPLELIIRAAREELHDFSCPVAGALITKNYYDCQERNSEV